MNKITNIRKRIMALILAGTITVSASGCVEDNNNSLNDNYKDVTTEDIIEENNTEVPLVPEEQLPFMSEEEFNQHISVIDSVEPVYNFEEYYPTEGELKGQSNYLIDNFPTTECSYTYDGNIDEFFIKVRQNSDIYLGEHPEYVSAFWNPYSNSEKIVMEQMDFEDAFYNVLSELLETATNNLNEDMCAIEDIRIVFDYNGDNTKQGKYDYKEKLITIFPNTIRESSEMNGKVFSSQLKNVISHELNHVRQCYCKCNIDKENLFITMHSVINTFIESSAESWLYNRNNHSVSNEGMTYYTERELEALILMLGLFHDNMTTDDYYNAIFDCNMQELYNFCNVHNEDDIYKLHKIIYSMNALTSRNEFINNFIEDDNLTIDKVPDNVGYAYRSDIFEMFLKNMMTYTINHNNFSLKDNLVMLNIAKNIIVNNCYSINIIVLDNGSQDYTRSYDEKFVNDLVSLENAYISFLNDYYDISIEEIREMEQNEISDIDWYVSNICDTNYTNSYTSDDLIYAQNLVERFPLLKAILSSSTYYSVYEYSNFIDENKKLIKSKSE